MSNTGKPQKYIPIIENAKNKITGKEIITPKAIRRFIQSHILFFGLSFSINSAVYSSLNDNVEILSLE